MEYYDILGLDKNATDKEIKKAYYKLARDNHPDKVSDENREEATKKFQEIGEAYEVLSDHEKRKIYDQFGKEGLEKGEELQFFRYMYYFGKDKPDHMFHDAGKFKGLMIAFQAVKEKYSV